MDLDQFLNDPRSRRAFFNRAGVGFVGGSAMLLAACGGGDGGQGGQETGGGEGKSGSADVDILNSALDLENMAVAAYTAGAPLLKGEALRVGKQILGQEQEHADGLSQAIRQLGGTPNKAKPASAYNFPKLSSQRDVLRFANRLENTAIAAYIDAIPKLSDGKLRQTAAAITTNEAEHVTFLLQGLGQAPGVPSAFVTGRK